MERTKRQQRARSSFFTKCRGRQSAKSHRTTEARHGDTDSANHSNGTMVVCSANAVARNARRACIHCRESLISQNQTFLFVVLTHGNHSTSRAERHRTTVEHIDAASAGLCTHFQSTASEDLII